MPNYTFQNLSPFDFEQLARDILEAKYKKEFESFTPGRDSGIDLRYFKNKDRIIVQCKHYEKSGFPQLKRSLTEEKCKLQQLTPSKYIIVTSVTLTPSNKDKILQIFEDFPIESEDIIDAVEINSILAKNTDIEKRHTKLWMDSASVLEKIIHSDIYNISEITKQTWKSKICLWVKNEYYYRAVNILEQKNLCIISGIPGIGKTTMAEMLCLYYCKEKYEFYKIQSLKDFFKLLKQNKKQIYYYDDFLGATQFEEKHEFDNLKNVLTVLNKHTKFILTTREYIYQQGKEKSEKLALLDITSTILTLSDYSVFQKAEILYNHLYFSNVPYIFCKYIIENNRYEKIINHHNYSPRLIEWMTNQTHDFIQTKPEEYYSEFIKNLNTPSKIWDKAFNNHISQASRYLLYVLYFLGNNISIDNLKEISFLWAKYLDNQLKQSMYTEIFRKSLYELENSFIAISTRFNHNFISFHNPSITDYIRDKIHTHKELETEFYGLEQKYWDQKNYFIEKEDSDKETIKKQLILLLKNIKINSIKRTYDVNSYSIGPQRLYYIMNNLNKHGLDELKPDFFNAVIEIFLNQELLSETLGEIMLKIPKKYFTNHSIKSKLLNDFLKTDTIEETTLYLKLNQIENFIPPEKYDRIIEKNIESDMDYARSVDSDSYQVQLIRDSFEELANLNFTVIPDEYFNRLDEIYFEKEEHESQQGNTNIDYAHNDQRKDMQDIKDLFNSFEK